MQAVRFSTLTPDALNTIRPFRPVGAPLGTERTEVLVGRRGAAPRRPGLGAVKHDPVAVHAADADAGRGHEHGGPRRVVADGPGGNAIAGLVVVARTDEHPVPGPGGVDRCLDARVLPGNPLIAADEQDRAGGPRGSMRHGHAPRDKHAHAPGDKHARGHRHIGDREIRPRRFSSSCEAGMARSDLILTNGTTRVVYPGLECTTALNSRQQQ